MDVKMLIYIYAYYMYNIYIYMTYIYIICIVYIYICSTMATLLQKIATFALEGSSAGGKAGQAAPEGRLVGA